MTTAHGRAAEPAATAEVHGSVLDTASADLVIVRIRPEKPTDGSSFAESLTGLTLELFDRSFAYPNGGRKIGGASFDQPDRQAGVIVQHAYPPDVVDELVLQAVATAVVVVDHDTPEYQTADVLLKAARGDVSVAVNSVDYNVDESVRHSLPLPPLPDSSDTAGQTYQKLAAYETLAPTALYLALPVVDSDPTRAHLDIPKDGTPPSFTELRTAVEKVLSADPTGTVNLASLSAEQSRNIAYEIVWNRNQLPLPTVPGGNDQADNLAQLYTQPGSDDKDVAQSRQQFEADLTSYYTTNNGLADQLTKYVYSLSAALACQVDADQAARVAFAFPMMLPGSPVQAPGQVAEATVGLSGPGLGFDVPAPYFYALGAALPTTVSPDVRFRMATVGNERQTVTRLQAAIDAGVIADHSSTVATTTAAAATPDPAEVSIEQAARRLQALGATDGLAPVCAPGVAATLVGDWLAYDAATTGDPEADLAGFWNGLDDQDKADHRDLVICAVTGLPHPDQAPDDLVSAIKSESNPTIPINTSADLRAITTAQWTRVFTDRPQLLVDITDSGSIAQRVNRFVRRLSNFFTVTSSPTGPATATESGPPQLPQSINDPVLAFLSGFTANFAFGQAPSALDPSTPAFVNAMNAVFPDDQQARAWLTQALTTIDTLYRISNVTGDDPTRFSITEAVFARGFTDTTSITALTADEFADALIGTVAHPYAGQIQTNAGGPAPASASTGSGRPVNPEGTLTDCRRPRNCPRWVGRPISASCWPSPAGPAATTRHRSPRRRAPGPPRRRPRLPSAPWSPRAVARCRIWRSPEPISTPRCRWSTWSTNASRRSSTPVTLTAWYMTRPATSSAPTTTSAPRRTPTPTR